MRVLHCIYDDPANPWVGGGASVRLREIYRRLAGRLAVTLATGNFPGARDETADGVQLARLGAAYPYAWSRLTYARAATRLLAVAPYDAAVFDFSAYTPIRVPDDRPVGLMLTQLAGPSARARWGAPVGALVRRWEAAQLDRGRLVGAIAHSLLHEAGPMLRPGIPTAVVGAAADDRYFAIRRAEDDYLLYYGRFDVFQKGLDVLVEAVALLAARRPGVRVVVAGRGRDAARVARMVAERELGDRVELVEDPAPARVESLLAGALAMVMPSRFEGLPLAAIEAMAAGVPLVGSDIPALREVLGEPAGGVLVPPGDAAALGTALGGLLDDPRARAALSSRARRSAERYRWDAVAEDHLAFLRRVAASAS